MCCKTIMVYCWYSGVRNRINWAALFVWVGTFIVSIMLDNLDIRIGSTRSLLCNEQGACRICPYQSLISRGVYQRRISTKLMGGLLAGISVFVHGV